MICKIFQLLARNLVLNRSSLILSIVLFVSLLLVCQLFQDYSKPLNPEFVPKPPEPLQISVVTVVANRTQAESDYSTALSTVRCYCRMHNYQFFMIQDSEFKAQCNQSDFMFRRHCIVAEILKITDYVVFLDADMAVVNPQRLLESFINPKFDITFYDRFVNWEIAAGSYIVKNSPWAIDFLKRFADFEKELPDSFHGTDNGALHAFWQREFYPELSEKSKICYKIWKKSTGFDDLFTYEACIRSIIGDNHVFVKARILQKGTSWVRDIWLSNSQWSMERDFMLHGLKEIHKIDNENEKEKDPSLFVWKSPLLSPINLELCDDPDMIWDFDKDLIVEKEVVEKDLSEKFLEVERRKWRSTGRIANFL